MTWWNGRLFDSNALITLDKAILERGSISPHFGNVLALEASFTTDQMYPETEARVRPRVTIQPPPTPAEVATILDGVKLSKGLAEVDQLVFATAVHFNLAVVTADKRLGRALLAQTVSVANMAMAFRELVNDGKHTEEECEQLLTALAKKGECLVMPSTWVTLKAHVFP